jgi:YggT family protein
MLEIVIGVFDIVLAALRPAVFVTGVLTAVASLGSWAVRTRRVPPFSPVARFIRERVDPWMVAPMEKRLLRAGGTPYAAPWWSLAAVVVGGLVLISVVGFVRNQLAILAYASQSGDFLSLLVRWSFGILQIALFARVISSWVGGSPYSKWWRWSYVITEPILAPLRRVVPTIGMLDVTVLVAYFGLQLLESVILRAL